MRIALASDEPYPVHGIIRAHLEARGLQPVVHGAFDGGPEVGWAQVAATTAGLVASSDCECAVLLCWSGTGIAMAANKLAGIRAALCTDAGTARAARQWNDANVLCLSNRMLSGDIAREILDAWFDNAPLTEAREGIDAMNALDARTRSQPA